MKVYRGIEAFEKVKNPVLTTGTFDGVHIGHQKIIQQLKDVAQTNNGETVLLTFSPHPRQVLNPDSKVHLLNTQEEKIRKLRDAGIDHLIIHPFTKEFSRTTSVVFVRDIIVNSIGTKHLVIGYDHHFGRNREGSFEHLKEFGPLYGFDVQEISALDVDHVNVSSTKIRNALASGDIRTANTYLSYNYNLTGKVIGGQKLGRKINFPTANIEVSDSAKLIPGNGAYAVRIGVKGIWYNAMLNIGTRPTINGPEHESIEAHIFNFGRDIYGEEVKVEFIEHLRPEKKFANLEDLKKQLYLDKQKTLNLLQ